jgi:phosphotransferase system enzyme I (PtsP)
MAGDYLGILLLIAIGYRKFSMNLSNIAKIKYLLRRIDISKVKQIVDQSGLTNINAIRTSMRNYINEQNLTNFVLNK